MKLLTCLVVVAASLSAEPHRMAVVSLLHAHVWLHLGTMLKGDKVQLVGVSETLPDLIARATREDVIPQTNNVTRPGVPSALVYSDWKKMIDETKPEIVWAFTPTNGHVDVVRYCAPRGIHVMVEKPLAATLDEALEIQALARKHHIQVLTNYGSTWQPLQQSIRAAVDEGQIGRVWRLRSITGHGGPGDPKKSSFAAWLADPVRNGGGVLMDFGCYSVLWSIGLMGKPESVYATAQHLKPDVFPDVEDHALIVLNYSGGLSVIEATWDMPPAQRAGNEIYGTTGSIVGSAKRRVGGPPAGEPIEVKALPAERAEPIAYMVERLRSGQPIEGPSALDVNVAVQEVLEAAKLSIRTGRAVKLPLK